MSSRLPPAIGLPATIGSVTVISMGTLDYGQAGGPARLSRRPEEESSEGGVSDLFWLALILQPTVDGADARGQRAADRVASCCRCQTSYVLPEVQVWDLALLRERFCVGLPS